MVPIAARFLNAGGFTHHSDNVGSFTVILINPVEFDQRWIPCRNCVQKSSHAVKTGGISTIKPGLPAQLCIFTQLKVNLSLIRMSVLAIPVLEKFNLYTTVAHGVSVPQISDFWIAKS